MRWGKAKGERKKREKNVRWGGVTTRTTTTTTTTTKLLASAIRDDESTSVQDDGESTSRVSVCPR